MIPNIMEPVRTVTDAVPLTPPSSNYHYNGVSNANIDAYRGEQGRHFTAPVFHKANPHSDAHVSGDDFERACVIYVSGLNSHIDEQLFFDAFRKFGNMVSAVRRTVDFEMKPNGQQYAFIRYSTPQEAQYAIQTGEIEVMGRKLIIKPRDKKGPRQHRNSSFGNAETKSSFSNKAGEKILRMINKNHGNNGKSDFGSDKPLEGSGIPLNTYQSQGNIRLPVAPSGNVPILMSKALTASNLPYDMSPKELFTLFSEIGPVEGCYIFPFGDHNNRRFGHIVMASFFLAQKAVESFNGIKIRGSVLEVGYKTMPNDTIGNSQQSAAGQIQPVYFSPTTPSPSHSQHHAHHSSWPQQNMGPISPSLYGNVHQTYGLSPPPLVPLGVFNGQCPPNIYQPMDFRYGSPSMSPSSSPSHGGVQWTRSPEQRMQQPANHAFHHNGTISNFGVPRNTPTTVSTADIHSRSVSSSTHAGTFPSPLAPIEVQVYRDMCDKQLPQKHCVSGSVQELPVSENTGIDSHGHSSRNSNSTINFEIANPVTIPEAAKPTDPCNLFIKNLDDALVNTSEELKNLFEPYGAVASAHLATYHESKISRGFGFVAFTKAEDAAKAKEDLNNSLVGKKRVFVSYAERKEDRAKRLRSLFQGTSTDLCDGEDCKELVGQITQEIDTNKSGSAEIQQGEMNFKNSSENVSPNGTELQVPKISTLKDGVETVLHSHGGNNSRQAARDHAAIPNANQSGCNVEITTLVSATGRRDKVSVSETLEGVSPSTKGSPKDNCDKSSTKVSANNKRVHPSTKRVSSPQKAPVAQNQNASMTSRNNSIGRGPSMTSNQNKNLNTSSSTQSADKQTSKKKGYRRNGRNFDRNVNDRGSAQNSSNITVDQQTPEKGVASQVGITVAAH